MKLMQRIGLTIGIIGTLLVVVACGGATPTPLAPAGATRGLNTFVFLYSEN